MTTAEQFLKRIADVPDDDLVRGVFADYLDEHGHRESAAWHRAGGRMTGEEFARSVIAQDDDNDYQESGWVACVIERAGVPIALLGRYGHCSCYGTWASLTGGGISDWPADDEVRRPVWDWIGSPADLAAMADRLADPAKPDWMITDQDYDYDHLLAVYSQVAEWWRKNKEQYQ